MRRVRRVLAAVLLVSSSAVLGHEGATGIVKQRMNEMKATAGAVKRIGERLRSKRELTAVASDADAIAAAAARMPALFPTGSRDGHSEATAAIWDRWPDFVVASRTLMAASEKLAAAARSGDAATTSAQLRLVTRACGGCHDAFRARH